MGIGKTFTYYDLQITTKISFLFVHLTREHYFFLLTYSSKLS
jgi:hypothetical protein